MDSCTDLTVGWAIQKKTAALLFLAPTCGCSATIFRNRVLLWSRLPMSRFAEVLSADAYAPSCTRAGSTAWQLTEALRSSRLLQSISACHKAGFCWSWTWRRPMWDISFVRLSAERCPALFGRAVMPTCGRGCGKKVKRYLTCTVTMPPTSLSRGMGDRICSSTAPITGVRKTYFSSFGSHYH